MKKNWTIALGISCLTSAVACAEVESSDSTSDLSTAASSAVGGVEGCVAEALACKAGAPPTTGDSGPFGQVAACEEGLRSCLHGLVPEAGAPPVFHQDAAEPVVVDAGLPNFPVVVDAGLPNIPAPVDAGLPNIPVVVDAAGSPVVTCLLDLGACLQAGTGPTICVADVKACLKVIIDAPRDAVRRDGGHSLF